MIHCSSTPNASPHRAVRRTAPRPWYQYRRMSFCFLLRVETQLWRPDSLVDVQEFFFRFGHQLFLKSHHHLFLKYRHTNRLIPSKCSYFPLPCTLSLTWDIDNYNYCVRQDLVIFHMVTLRLLCSVRIYSDQIYNYHGNYIEWKPMTITNFASFAVSSLSVTSKLCGLWRTNQHVANCGRETMVCVNI